jgi:hypothetical protein
MQWIPVVLYPGVKRQEREADYSPSHAEVENGGAIPSLPDIPPWHSAEQINNKDKFTLHDNTYVCIVPSFIILQQISCSDLLELTGKTSS